MLKSSVFSFIIVTFQLLSLNGELQQKIEDEEALCLTIDVLCVKDVILKISKAAKDIHNTAFDIERNMVKRIVFVFLKNFFYSILVEKRKE